MVLGSVRSFAASCADGHIDAAALYANSHLRRAPMQCPIPPCSPQAHRYLSGRLATAPTPYRRHLVMSEDPSEAVPHCIYVPPNSDACSPQVTVQEFPLTILHLFPLFPLFPLLPSSPLRHVLHACRGSSLTNGERPRPSPDSTDIIPLPTLWSRCVSCASAWTTYGCSC